MLPCSGATLSAAVAAPAAAAPPLTPSPCCCARCLQGSPITSDTVANTVYLSLGIQMALAAKNGGCICSRQLLLARFTWRPQPSQNCMQRGPSRAWRIAEPGRR